MKYATNEQTVLNYIAANFDDNAIVQFGSIECDCGESYGCQIYDNNGGVERIAICEECYNNAPYHDRI